jgi:molecular chaperone GrpE
MSSNNTETIKEEDNFSQDNLKEDKDTIDIKNKTTEDLSQEEKIDKLKEENEILKEKISSLEEDLKRAIADFLNSKNRLLKDTENTIFQKNSKIILEFLHFKEHLEKAIEHEENKNSKENLIILKNNFENILNRLNIKQLDLLGKEFDYNLAECVQRQEVLEKEKENKILEILENGYLYQEKLIKPAKVIIGKFKEE